MIYIYILVLNYELFSLQKDLCLGFDTFLLGSQVWHKLSSFIKMLRDSLRTWKEWYQGKWESWLLSEGMCTGKRVISDKLGHSGKQ